MIRLSKPSTVDWARRAAAPLERWLNAVFPLHRNDKVQAERRHADRVMLALNAELDQINRAEAAGFVMCFPELPDGALSLRAERMTLEHRIDVRASFAFVEMPSDYDSTRFERHLADQLGPMLARDIARQICVARRRFREERR